jgi:glycine cleavage system aminomethyltransferase T
LDVSSAYAVLALMGPNSRRLLSSVTDADLSNEAFPFGTSQIIDVGYARVRASRITYVGELGWELHIPSEFVQSVYDEIVGIGPGFGLAHTGYHAINSLRIEKAYRHWGHDITDEDSPLEAGLCFTIAWSKPDGFIGRESLQRQKERGVHRRLANFKLLDGDSFVYHNEPIWRDGCIVGCVTSGMFGHTIARSLATGYVTNPEGLATPEWVNSGQYELEIAAERFPAQVSLRPFYDPANERIKA